MTHEIDPHDISSFPENDAAERHESTFDFLREHDPDFLADLESTSSLLEQADPATHNLRFTLTEEAYQQLDTPKKKLTALLLLRTRVSDLLPGVIEELRAIHDIDEVTDLRTLYQAAQNSGKIRPVVDTFLSSPMGEGRMTLEFLQNIYDDPLLTNTTSIMVGDTNHVRDRFTALAERTIQAEIARENALMPPPELPDLDRVRLLAHTQRALEAELAQLSDPTDRQVNLASQRTLLETIATLSIPEDLADSVRQTRRSLTHVQERLDAVKELEAGRSEPLTSARRRRLQREIQLSTARRRVLDVSVNEYDSIYNTNQGNNSAKEAVTALSFGGRLFEDHREALQKFSNLLEQFLGQATPDGITQLVQVFDQLPEDEREKLFQGHVSSGGHHYLTAEGKDNPFISFMLNRDLVLSFMQWAKEEFRPEKGRGNLKNILKSLSEHINWDENANQEGLREEITRFQELLLKAVKNPFIKGYLQLKGSIAGDDVKMAAFRDKKGEALDAKIAKTLFFLNAETEYEERLTTAQTQVAEAVSSVTEKTREVRESITAWVSEQEEIRSKLGYKARQWARNLVQRVHTPQWLRTAVERMSPRLLEMYQNQWRDLPSDQQRRRLRLTAATGGAIAGVWFAATQPEAMQSVGQWVHATFSALGTEGQRLAQQATLTPETAHAVTPTPEATAQVVTTLTPTPTPEVTEVVKQALATVTSTPVSTEEIEHGVSAARILTNQAQQVRDFVDQATIHITANQPNLTLAVQNTAQQLADVCTPNWVNPETGVTKFQVLINQITDWIKAVRGTTVVHIGDKLDLGQILGERGIRSLLDTCRTNNVFDYIRLIIGR